jgi:restriction system protein
MARKKKSTPADDLIEIIAFLPWWLGVTLAIFFYFLLHSMASAEVSLAAGHAGEIGQFAVNAFKQTLASIGQYLVPVLCLIGAVVSALRRRARARLLDNVIKGDSSSGLREMSWQEFELVVGEAFRLRGYAVIETGGGGADGGIDLILKKDGEKFIVQCKQWRALKVGVSVVRELYGVMAAGGVSGGFVVTCGRFTDEARAFANGRDVTLVDGNELEIMIRESSGGAKPIPSNPVTPIPVAIAAPKCPICSSGMVERTAKRGANAGNRFWGCVAYPACKGTAPAK